MPSSADSARETLKSKRPSVTLARMKATAVLVAKHLTKHTGVGLVCAVAYFDPGNWGVDLQAGAEYGYKLLFVVLLSGIFAVYFQVLAARLGCVTGLDLASHCRLLLHDRPRHTLLCRWLVLYPLYALSEIAIISTDLAELLGSAIALNLLFPKMPLWAGVLLTGADVLFLLALRDPLGGQPVRFFELLIAFLVIAVLICMAIIISSVDVHWGDAFDGFLPSKTLGDAGALYTAIGIIGATVMPHSLFLGSALATQDRVSPPIKDTEKLSLTVSNSSTCFELSRAPSLRDRSRDFLHIMAESVAAWFRIIPLQMNGPKRHADRENNTFAFVRAHVYHGTVDMVISLLGFAVVINSMILILASAVFHYGSGEQDSDSTGNLFDTHDLIRDLIGKPAAVLFALALLAAGQSSSIIATMAGQTVSEGFLHWRISPILRRLLTRCLGLIPAMVVAIGVGKPGVDTLLVATQAALSIVLPFIVFPLVWLTSSKEIMSVKKPVFAPDMNSRAESIAAAAESGLDVERVEETVYYSNNRIVMWVGYLIWLVVVAANVYAIITLARGEGS